MKTNFRKVATYVFAFLAICSSSISVEAACNTGEYLQQSSGVYDAKTGLMWQKCSVGQEGVACKGKPKLMTIPQAVEYAAQFSTKNAGWRLPTVDELSTLLQAKCIEPKINQFVFPNALSVATWTSTTNDGSGYLVVDLANGYVDPVNLNTPKAVRLVKVIKAVAK